jgi:hypothetical protein
MHRLTPWLLGLVLIIAAWPVWAGGQPPLADRDTAAIHQVIAGQIAAFQNDDGAAAFAYATPALRERVGTPANFLCARVTRRCTGRAKSVSASSSKPTMR